MRRLPSASHEVSSPDLPELPELEAIAELEREPLPDGAHVYLSRRETYDHKHASISETLAQARIMEARAQIEQARETTAQTKYQYSVPAREQTKQVQERTAQFREMRWPVCIIVAICVLGASFNPNADAAKWIAAIGVAAIGLFATVTFVRSPKKQSKPSAPANTPSESEAPEAPASIPKQS